MGEDFLRVFESLESGRSREKSAHETRLNAADALADAVEAVWANRAWESTSAPEWKALGDALKAYREATK